MLFYCNLKKKAINGQETSHDAAPISHQALRCVAMGRSAKWWRCGSHVSSTWLSLSLLQYHSVLPTDATEQTVPVCRADPSAVQSTPGVTLLDIILERTANLFYSLCNLSSSNSVLLCNTCIAEFPENNSIKNLSWTPERGPKPHQPAVSCKSRSVLLHAQLLRVGWTPHQLQQSIN